MGEKELQKIESDTNNLVQRGLMSGSLKKDMIDPLIAEVRRLQNELQKTHESAFVYSWENKSLKEQREELWEENQTMTKALESIVNLPHEEYAHPYHVVRDMAQEALDQVKGEGA